MDETKSRKNGFGHDSLLLSKSANTLKTEKMIFYNAQLMQNESEAMLYMVTNPMPFDRFEDHQSAIYINIHELVERAIKIGEDPIALIEDYLNITYNSGQTIDEIASFLFQSDKMVSAMWTLKESWDQVDESVPQDSLMYGGIGKERARELYTEMTLRSYLETLAQEKNG